jgi:hypothetical protein
MVWGRKFKAIVESEKYDTLTVNELFSKHKSAEEDRAMTSKIEDPTDSHSLCRAYSLGTHARKDEDRLLVESPVILLGLVPCNPTRTPVL